MSSMRCIIQLTSECSLGVCLVLQINTDAAGFLVTKQFTGIHILDFDGCYVVFHQAFVSEEEISWES